MKNRYLFLTLLIISLLSSSISNAQILYGLQKSPVSTLDDPFDIVAIDPFTANTSILFGTDSLVAVAIGATAYDQQNKRYICWGFDNNNTQRLFVADIDSGAVVSKPLINAQPIEMEYDLQTQITYGLTYSQGVEYLVEVDLNTGIIANIAALPGVSAVVVGHSSYDSNLGRYIFLGIQNGQERLMTVDVSTGNILYSVPFNQGQERVIALEYDVNASKLYGLFNDIDSTNYNAQYQMYYLRMMFVEIDITTGTHTILNTTPVEEGFFAGFALGGLAFDQASRSYIVQTAGDNGFSLKVVNTATGAVASSVSLANLPKPFYEIQCDNFQFARSFYNLSATTTAQPTLQGKVYPNPATDVVRIELEETIEQITVYGIDGRVALSNQNPRQSQINISTLNRGIYIIEARTESGTFREKLVKQ